jgi:g-D-glutamyl-meso-diaminopimelate peptidase
MLKDFYAEPPGYERTAAAINRLKDAHKGLKAFPIGKSVLGRDITAMSIGNPMGATLFVGATHGLEWITTLLLLRFFETVLEGIKNGAKVSDIDIRRALKGRSLAAVPCLNPDGVEIALYGKKAAGELAGNVDAICGGDYSKWQANARGVDINHNFDAGWRVLREMERKSGIDGPAPTRYGGASPESEPETRAITTFCLTYQPRSLYSMHAQGEEIYYRYGVRTPQRSRLMAQILAASSGYTPADPTGLASHGGLKDWYIDRFCRPGFTVEVGKGKNPLDISKLDAIYRKIEEMLVIATLL